MPWDTDWDMVAGFDNVFEIDGALARRLYNIQSTRTQYQQRLQQVLDDAWRPDDYLAEIDRTADLLVPELIDAGKTQDAALMLNAMDLLRVWIAERRGNVLTQLAAAPPGVRDVQPTHLCEVEQWPPPAR
jgi:hypothetical protein